MLFLAITGGMNEVKLDQTISSECMDLACRATDKSLMIHRKKGAKYERLNARDNLFLFLLCTSARCR